MGHNQAAAKSLQNWYEVHRDHNYDCYATSQVTYVCHTCELIMTSDDILAGFLVTRESALRSDDILELIEEAPLA